MNVYDFDKTIYSGDSSLDFYLFCLKSKPSLVKYIPFQLFWLTKYMLGLCDKVSFKEKFFSFVRDINTKYAVERFWDKNISKVRPWYIKQKSKTDIIVSASPEFLVSSCMKRFSVGNCICTVVSEEDGTFLTPNCYGAEKLKRFKELYDIFNIDSFYSDSLSDRVMAKNSKKAYLVNRNHIISWNDYVLSNTQKIKNLFYTPEFFRFLFIGIINVFSSTLFSWIFSI
ncbi:MAG: haloacid dehalogenase-like hydrolase, partial [Clostridia bacterium]|nr:haloacid dehalogenase-like hydrolase [Clostridia bacterium]